MLFYSQWCRLPLYVRAEIARLLGIAKTGPTHVANDQIVSDGYKIEDVEAAITNIALMQSVTGTTYDDRDVLFDLVLARAEGREIPKQVEEKKVIEEVKPDPKKRGRKPKAK